MTTLYTFFRRFFLNGMAEEITHSERKRRSIEARTEAEIRNAEKVVEISRNRPLGRYPPEQHASVKSHRG